MSKFKEELDILYDDNHVLGLLKPSGWLSQGDKTGDKSVLDWGKAYLKEKYDKPGNVFLGCVHRLDRPTSGVMVYAKTSKALKRLNNEFAERQVTKKYIAVVTGETPKFHDKLVHFLRKNRKNNTVKAYTKIKPKSHKAILEYRMIGQIGKSFLLDISLKTGRPHQIRTQLSKAGFPIIGDVKYGARNPLPYADIALHCYDLEIAHPTEEKTIHIHHLPLSKEPWGKYNSLLKEIL